MATTAAGGVATAAAPTAYDEWREPDGTFRHAWHEVAAGIEGRSAADLNRLRVQVDRLLDDDGVSYHPLPGGPLPGAPSVVEEFGEHALRWHLDPLPLVIDAPTWTSLERGLLQRSALLNAVLADLYGEQLLLHRGLLDPEIVFGHTGYLRAAASISIPGRHQLFLHGVDVVRDAEGQFLASGDRTQAPSGVGYAMADRRAVSRVLPEEFARTAPHGLGGFFRTIRRALEAIAPTGPDDPRIVLLSPGTFSETAFDQAFTAAQLGIPVVGSADLTVRRGRLWMRALGRLEAVHVVLRRVDAEWSDPLDLRPGSRLGVAGLREVCRRGTVSVVNSLGSGVLENAALRAELPALCRELLGEDLELASVPTWWCGDDAELSHVLANLSQLQLQPLSGGPFVQGRTLSSHQLEVWQDRLRAERGRWVAQEVVAASVAPAAGTAGVQPQPVGMRLFSVAQQGGYAAMRGALGRVLADDGIGRAAQPVAKDVWVRTTAVEGVAPTPVVRVAPVEEGAAAHLRRAMVPVTSPRALADLFWLGRYAERTEDLVRLLLAVRARVDDFRFRPDAEGAGCVPVLMSVVDELVRPLPGGRQGVAAGGPGQVPQGQRQAHAQSQGRQSQGPQGQSQAGPSQSPGVASEVSQVSAPLVQMRSLMLDARRKGSVAQSLEGLIRAASAVRDQLSVETWIVLAAVERGLQGLATERVVTGASLQAAQTSVLTGMLALSGLSKENMVRDAGWHMLDAGRRVERSQQLVTLLRATLTTGLPDAVETLVGESVLSAGESIITYRRRYGGQVRVAGVCELLLLDRENPRSLSYQLEVLAEDLLALPDASGTSRPERQLHDLLTGLRRAVPEDLAVVGSDGRRAELVELLGQMYEGLRELADLIAAQHFWHQVEMQSVWGPVGMA